MFRTPAVLIVAGTSDAGSAALLPAADAAVDGAAFAVAAGADELGVAAVLLFLLAQPLSTSAAAIATMPAAWVRGRRRSGVTDPPGSGRRSGSRYGAPAPVWAGMPVMSGQGSPGLGTSCWGHLSSRLSALRWGGW